MSQNWHNERPYCPICGADPNGPKACNHTDEDVLVRDKTIAVPPIDPICCNRNVVLISTKIVGTKTLSKESWYACPVCQEYQFPSQIVK